MDLRIVNSVQLVNGTVVRHDGCPPVPCKCSIPKTGKNLHNL